MNHNFILEEKEKPIEARYPVSQGYGHKRALEKGGAVKGSGRAILFNKVIFHVRRAPEQTARHLTIKKHLFVLAKFSRYSVQRQFLNHGTHIHVSNL